MKLTKEDTNIIKGAAVLMLLYYHLFYYEPMFDAFPVDFRPFSLASVMGGSRIWNICVSMFLFLSVFGMYRSLEALEESHHASLNARQFFWYAMKRYFSLMLGYFAVYVTMIGCFFWDISGLDVYGTGPRAVFNVMMDVTGLSQYFNTPSINSSWWYLALAIDAIFLMPLLYTLMKKWDYLMIPLLLILPFLVNVDMVVGKFRITVLLALCCGKYRWLEKWKQHCFGSSYYLSEFVKLLAMIFVACFAVYFRQFEGDAVPESLQYLAEGILAFVLVAIFFEYAPAIPGVRKLFGLLGRSSMNIYFAHLFFSYYMIRIRSAIFSCHYFLLIYLALTVVVLVYSLLLEQLKKRTGYNRINERLRQFCESRINQWEKDAI